MTAALARFASSADGSLYRITCERWGVDPGAIFPDDVEAYLMRQSLMLASSKSAEQQVAEVTDIYDEWASSV